MDVAFSCGVTFVCFGGLFVLSFQMPCKDAENELEMTSDGVKRMMIIYEEKKISANFPQKTLVYCTCMLTLIWCRVYTV